VAVAGDVDHAAHDGEDLARVFSPGVLQPGGQAGQVLAVEQRDDGTLRADLAGLAFVGTERDHEGGGERDGTEAGHGGPPRARPGWGVRNPSVTGARGRIKFFVSR